jgi:hypothetical protein
MWCLLVLLLYNRLFTVLHKSIYQLPGLTEDFRCSPSNRQSERLYSPS